MNRPEEIKDVDDDPKGLKESEIRVLEQQREHWRIECEAEAEGHRATRRTLATTKETLEAVKADRKILAVSFGVVCVAAAGLILYALVLKRWGGQAEAGFEAAQSLLEPCRQERDLTARQLAETQSALVICTQQGAPPACPECQQPVCPSPLTEQLQAQVDACAEQISEVQQRWDAKFNLAQAAIDRARELGVGPTLRNWIGNPDAKLASREVFLSYEEWGEVNREREDLGSKCAIQLHEIVQKLAVMDQYRALTEWNRQDHRLENQLEQMYPHYVQWRVMEMELSREAAGCPEPLPEGRRR